MNKALQAELARTRAELKPDPADFARRQALHEQHVRALGARLRPAVAAALKEESAQLLAQGWVSEARQALSRWLLQSKAEETPADVLAREQAERELQTELAVDLVKLASTPTETEIDEHTVELAQLLLSNWIGHLEHALQDSSDGRLQDLVDAMPHDAHPRALLVGVEAFALDVGTASLELALYRQALAEAKDVIEMTPSVSIFHLTGRWYAARRHSDAVAWQEELREELREEERRRAIDSFQRTTANVTTVLTPMANSCAAGFWFGANYPVQAPALTLGEERQLVEAAALLALADESPPELGASIHTFVHDLEKIVRGNLNHAIHERLGTAPSWVEWETRALGLMATQTQVAPESILRCALYSKGVYVVAKRSRCTRALLGITGADMHHVSHHGKSNKFSELVTIIANAVKSVPAADDDDGIAQFLAHQVQPEDDGSQFGVLM